MKVRKIFFMTIVFIGSVTSQIFAGNPIADGDSTKKEFPGIVFANVYTGFYYTVDGNITPKSAFNFPTGLLGYTHKISDNVKGTLIYDVTRTTNFSYADTSGISNYFEGSKYTAFLKMAQIDWRINKTAELSFGQLLNEQYLTLQDKFWGYRYIAVTFQEMNRFGNPADFGARLKIFMLGEKLQYSITAVNGEGPFCYQDNYGKFLISNNIEYAPSKEWIIKIYGDYMMPPSDTMPGRIVLSPFIGYKCDKFRVGLEYDEIFNQGYSEDNNYVGLSLYGSYTLSEKFDILGRCDYIHSAGLIEKSWYTIAGLQYQPVKNFCMSVNTRYSLDSENDINYTMIYANIGIKF